MVPPLRERLGLAAAPEQPAAAVAEARPDTGLMARSLMYLFAIGGAVTLLSLLVSGPQAEETFMPFLNAATLLPRMVIRA